MTKSPSVTPDDLRTMRELIAGYKEGFALPRHFYTSQAVYEQDLKTYWNHSWIWAGHVSQIPEPGNFFVFDYGQESVIVVRDRENAIQAHVNVCRHRGSRVCLKRSGTARVFSCPYHAWTYELNGGLRAARDMPPEFNREDYSLLSAKVLLFQGLIFVSLANNPPSLDEALVKLAPLTAPFGLENLKVAHEESYPVPANWKLALENYMECYHCAPSHKEYSRSHSLKDPREMAELIGPLKERSLAAGLPTEEVDWTGSDSLSAGAALHYRRYPLFPGYKTGSKTGNPIAPLLGELRDFDGGATDLQIGTLNNFLIYSDHLVGYRFIPRQLQETDIQIVWMVRADAEEGTDYDRDNLTWLWHVTSQDDERIIRHNQEGVNSHAFVPGPLAKTEEGIRSFYHSYFGLV